MGLNRSPEPTVPSPTKLKPCLSLHQLKLNPLESTSSNSKLKPCSTSPRPSSYLSEADLPGSKEVKLEVKIDKIKLSIMENGVLIVTVPKEEMKKTAIKSTEISG